jgi:holin-like protein
MRGLAILLAFNLLGLLVSKLAHVPLPGNVVGLMLFTACLFAGWIRVEWVEEAAGFLLRHMLLFFAPYVVGTIAFTALLRGESPAVVLGVGGSFLVVLLVTGWMTTLLLRGRRTGSAFPATAIDEKAGEA